MDVRQDGCKTGWMYCKTGWMLDTMNAEKVG